MLSLSYVNSEWFINNQYDYDLKNFFYVGGQFILYTSVRECNVGLIFCLSREQSDFVG